MLKPTLTPYTANAPSRTSPATFSADGDYMMAFIANLPAQINPALDYVEMGVETVSDAVSTVEDTLVEVQAASLAATQVANSWVSGSQYQKGYVVWSPLNFGSYRARLTHSEETSDPSVDVTNWASLSSGDHVERTDNPHSVTAAQVGAYTQAEVDAAIAGITAADVGAYTQAEVDAAITAANADWARVSGNGTISVAGSGVSSVLRNGVGDYTVFFTTSTTANNQAAIFVNVEGGYRSQVYNIGQSHVRFNTLTNAGVLADLTFNILRIK